MAIDGVIEDVPSPTFTLVQTYDTSIGEFWHADLYRLTAPEEADELGLDGAMAHAITLIEWPERLGPHLPARHLSITFTECADPDARRITFAGVGDGWHWLEAVV